MPRARPFCGLPETRKDAALLLLKPFDDAHHKAALALDCFEISFGELFQHLGGRQQARGKTHSGF